MKDIKVLGPGCKRCQTTEDMVKAAASAWHRGFGREDHRLCRDGQVRDRVAPGIVIDGKVVHAGGLPKENDLMRWLQA